MVNDIFLNNFKFDRFDIREIFAIQYVDNLIETSDKALVARSGDLLKICISQILCLSKNKTKSRAICENKLKMC